MHVSRTVCGSCCPLIFHHCASNLPEHLVTLIVKQSINHTDLRKWILLHAVSEPVIKTTLINESDGKVENNEMDKRNEHRISVRKRNE